MQLDLDSIVALVREAGDRALELGTGGTRRRKDGGSFVTEADELLQGILRDGLARIDPASGFLGEEDGGHLEGPLERYWAIDPIDGTESYMVGLPVWGVSAGLVCEGEPVTGAVYFPRFQELYWADGGRAFLNGEPLEFPAPRRSRNAWAVPSNSHRRYEIQTSGKLRNLGSTAYHILMVAQGMVDGAVLGRVHVWDVAGAMAIARLAGVHLEDFDGVPRPLGTWLPGFQPPFPVLCGEPAELDRMRKSIRPLAASRGSGP